MVLARGGAVELFSTGGPVAAGGRLFVGPARLDEETGAQLWAVGAEEGRLDAVSDTVVFVNSGCENTLALAAADGAFLWLHSGTRCTSATPGLESSVAAGRLFEHDLHAVDGGRGVGDERSRPVVRPRADRIRRRRGVAAGAGGDAVGGVPTVR